MSSSAGRLLPVICPRGEFDFLTAASLTIALLGAAEGSGGVILDASGITFADSSVLNALMNAHQQTRLRIAAAPEHLVGPCP
jgi:anti-anti-sigma regulatory factor